MAFFPKLFQSRTKNQNRIFITLCEVSPVLYGREDMHRAFSDYQEKRKHRIPHPAQSFHLNVRADKYIRDIKRTDTGVYGPEDIII